MTAWSHHRLGFRTLLTSAIGLLSASGGADVAVAQVGERPRVVRTSVPVSEGTALRGVLSPDGTQVAIILLGTVHVVSRATGKARVITDPASDPDEYLAVAWSPDGSRLAMMKGFFPPTLRIVDVATGARTAVTTRESDSDDLIWNNRLGLLTIVQRDDSVDLVSYPATARAPGTVVATLPRDARGLALSPDGYEIAFVNPTNISYLPTGQSQISLKTIGTGAVRPLTDIGGFDAFPAYSPSGEAIAVVARRGGDQRVWVMRRDGSEARPVSAAEDSVEMAPLSWTPDGKHILFVSRGRLRTAPVDGGPSAEVPFSATFTVARWTGLRRPAVPAPGTRLRAKGIVEPELAPDGRSVAFGALGDLWVAPVAGGPPRRIVETPHRFEFLPRWSRDGARIAYLALDPGADPVLRVHTLASRHDTAFTLPRLPDAMSWSPDGRQIALAGANLVAWLGVATGALSLSGPQPSFITSFAGWTERGDSVAFSMAAPRDSILALGPPRFARAAASAGAIGTVWTPAASPEAENAAWSWGLGRVAFTREGTGYWTTVASSGEASRIADPSPTDFSWSADQSRLGYLSAGRYRVLEVGSGRARTVDLAPAFAVAPAAPPVLIHNVRVIDGTGSPPSAPKDVMLRGGRVVQIAAGGTLRAGQGVRRIDGTGKTLLPGLFDMHAHMDGANIAGPSPGFLYYGVLAARDMGSPRGRAVAMRERALLGSTPSPRLFTSAGRFRAAYGHESRDADYRVAPNMDSAGILRGVQAVLDGGSDYLKTYSFRNHGFDARAAQAAHSLGLPVTQHATTPGTAFYGIEGHEHAQPFFGNEWTAPWREDLVGIVKAGGICVTPTLLTYPMGNLRGPASPLAIQPTDFTASPFLPPGVRQAALEEFGARALPPERRADWERYFRQDLASILRLHRAGVRILAGTDRYPEGRTLHWELELLVMAGLTPLEAIRAATFDAATCLGVEASLGSIALGKVADLVLVSGDPAARIQDLANVELVFLGGKPIARSELLALVRNP
jgi:dipeptidyl aminopeptidase/acylaminoacyl peptidase